MKPALSFRHGPAVLIVVLLLMPATTLANAAWDALRQPGAIAIMRHALAPGTGDPAGFTLGDCSTQRNLDEAGRAQARAIGQVIRSLGVEVDRVLTSEWCRCRETAELLGVGEVEAFPALNSFFADRSTRDAQTSRTRAFLAGLRDDARIILVTHQVNITALTGRFASSGEAIIIDVEPDGTVLLLGEAGPPRVD